MYDGDALAQKGAVVVTYNYRLGSIWIPGASGINQGIRPQRVRQLRHDGHGRGAALGAKEHREFRRRPASA